MGFLMIWNNLSKKKKKKKKKKQNKSSNNVSVVVIKQQNLRKTSIVNYLDIKIIWNN